MSDEIEKLPLNKYDQLLHPQEISPISLFFREKKWERELSYIQEHDPLFKYYIFASFITLFAMGLILILTEQAPHYWVTTVYTIAFVMLSTLIPCLWVSYIWDQTIDPHYDYEARAIQEPDIWLIKKLYRSSQFINTSVPLRTAIYFLISLLVILSAVLDVANATCLAENSKNYTYRCAMAMMVTFLFLRIHHYLKLLSTFCVLAFYVCLILPNHIDEDSRSNIFSSEYFGYNTLLSPEYKCWSHICYLFVTAVFFFFADRHHEYMHRLDYQWKRQLKSEQEQASATRLVNKMLLQNILPHHVAERYLSHNQETGSLYSEGYSNVAVMFASIPGFCELYQESEVLEKGVNCLKALNEIIASFDKLLFEAQFGRVEKIKVISSTYMAACGLQPGQKKLVGEQVTSDLIIRARPAQGTASGTIFS